MGLNPLNINIWANEETYLVLNQYLSAIKIQTTLLVPILV
jgi:hypothetical protein